MLLIGSSLVEILPWIFSMEMVIHVYADTYTVDVSHGFFVQKSQQLQINKHGLGAIKLNT